jgi:hypothetical protein
LESSVHRESDRLVRGLLALDGTDHQHKNGSKDKAVQRSTAHGVSAKRENLEQKGRTAVLHESNENSDTTCDVVRRQYGSQDLDRPF